MKNLNEFKRNIKKKVKCPLCEEEIEMGIELNVLKKLNPAQYFHYPHIYLHGDPLHAIICYIDSELNIRNIGVIKSIEISRDHDTFRQLIRKWMNLY